MSDEPKGEYDSRIKKARTLEDGFVNRKAAPRKPAAKRAAPKRK